MWHTTLAALTPLAFLSFCLATAAPRAYAQSTHQVMVGDSTLRLDVVRPAQDTFLLVTVRNGVRLPATTLVRRFEPTFVDAQPAWRMVQNYQSPSGASSDTSVVLAGSLAPVRYGASLQHERHAFEFSVDRITGTISRSDAGTEVVDVVQESPVFIAVADDLILGSLPWHQDYVAEYRSYNPGRGFATVRVAVLDDSSLVAAGEQTAVWVVSYDAGAAPGQLWIARESGRVIRARYRLAQDAEFWRVRPADLPLIPGAP